MKVLILDMGSRLNRFGGEQKIAAGLYKRLGKNFKTFYLGYETDYLKKSENTIILPKKESKKNLRNSKFSEMRIFRAAYYYIFVRKLIGLGISKEELLKKIKMMNPDIIIANSIHDYAVIKFLERNGLNFKSIYIDHGSISTDNTSGYFSKEGIPITIGTGINAFTLKKAKQAFFASFDRLVALNLAQYKMIKKITNKVEYIPNGINNEFEKDVGLENEFRRSFSILKSDFVVLYVGRMFDRQKNVSVLIKAFKSIKDERLKLLLIGDGPSFPDYMELAAGDPRIHFGGRRTEREINAIYYIANLFVLPSNWEGFNLTILEAAEHSLPIIVSKNVYCEDFKNKNIIIESFETKNVKELKNKIIEMYKNKTVRDCSIKTSEKIAHEFSEDKMLKEYEKIIKDI
jgi:glycosyltransferase involved in cell wall biosynthesis